MKNKQTGLTFISWIIILGIIAFFATLAIRIVPIYSEYYTVVNVVKGMEKEIRDNKLSEREVRKLFTKRFQVNNIKSVGREDIKLSRGRGSVAIKKVVIDYDVEVPFIAQLNLIGHFHQEIDVESKR